MTQLRYEYYDPKVVGITSTRVHGMMTQPISQSRFLCGIRLPSIRVQVGDAHNNPITCRKCLEVLERNEQIQIANNN